MPKWEILAVKSHLQLSCIPPVLAGVIRPPDLDFTPMRLLRRHARVPGVHLGVLPKNVSSMYIYNAARISAATAICILNIQ